MNLSIYQKGPDGNIQVIEQTTDIRGREVHLKFTQDPQNPSHNYYNAIFQFDNSGWVFDKDKHDIDRPSPTRQQMMQQ